MDDSDAFFTRTIVGAPFSALLGPRVSALQARAQGLEVDLQSGRARLSRAAREWVLLGRPLDAKGRPMRRPGAVRRWLERHALIIAACGTACLLGSMIVVGARPWN